jgi:hypothetical protein
MAFGDPPTKHEITKYIAPTMMAMICASNKGVASQGSSCEVVKLTPQMNGIVAPAAPGSARIPQNKNQAPRPAKV